MMFKKRNQRVTLGVIGSVMIGSMMLTSAQAAIDECGQASLIEAGSTGVNVSKNGCDSKARLDVGSVLELTAGSRVWLKFDPNATGESFQLICQNKSAQAVTVNITSAASPWIMPQGAKSCGQWTNNKLSCENSSGQKNSFFCAVSSNKPLQTANAPEQTTSVKLRSLTLPKLISVDDVIQDISPEIELCKSLYNVAGKVEVSWTVTNTGMIKDLQVKSTNKDLVSCVESVAKQSNANQELSIKHAF